MEFSEEDFSLDYEVAAVGAGLEGGFVHTRELRPVKYNEAGTILMKADANNASGNKKNTYFRSGVGKLLHMTRWSHPEIQNAVRELTRHGNASVPAHDKAMHRTMEYCISTPN